MADRPSPKRRVLKFVAVFALLLIVVIAAALFLLHRAGMQKRDRALAALQQRGLLPQASPAGQDLAAFIADVDRVTGHDPAGVPFLNSTVDLSFGQPIPTETAAHLRTYAAAAQADADTLRALTVPSAGPIALNGLVVTEENLNALGGTRRLARHLAALGEADFVNGDPDAALGHALTMVDLTDRMADNLLVTRLVIVSIQALSFDETMQLLSRSAPSSAALDRAIARLRSIDPIGGELDMLNAEAGYAGAAISGQGVLGSSPPRVGWVLGPFADHVENLLAAHDFVEPLRDQPAVFWDTLEQQLNTSTSPHAVGLSKGVLSLRKYHAARQVTLAGLCLERYRLARGDWPAALADLGDDAADLIDPYTGSPLLYQRVADGVVVYSVADNGKDDGGVQPTLVGDDIAFRLLDPAVRGTLTPSASP